MKRLVTGILAHVDSGKTTLSEALLYHCGQIRKLGRVDHGDAFLDTNEIEREKGITIFSKQAILKSDTAEFTLLDTPGHIDFSAETERTLQVLDYAILVISGTDVVESHTETLWKLLKRYDIPTFIFVNKMDISAYSHEEIIAQLKSKLSDGCIDFTDDAFSEQAALCGEELMEEYLNTDFISEKSIARAIKQRSIFPCMFGSALKTQGIADFFGLFDKYTLMPEYPEKFGAKVFKITQDGGTRLTHMKITGGNLRVKAQLCGTGNDGIEWTEKADRIRIYSGEKFTAPDIAESGTVCAVTGLNCTYPGEGLGIEADSLSPVLEPVLMYKVEILDGTDVHTVLYHLRRLEEEDPLLRVLWNGSEIQIRLMGEVQLEVLRRIILERFGVTVDFGQGSIAYRETITEKTEGVGHFEPLRHYAEVHLILEPLSAGSGLKFASSCSEDMLDRNWQRLILTHLSEKTHLGVLTGSPITDMKITLASGKAHKKHTEGGDFRQATYRAIRQGLRSAESILLEPWYSFELEIPQGNIGRAMTDIELMGGEFSQPEICGETAVICGSAPVSELRGYSSEITAYTGGRGRLQCSLKGYEPCRNSETVISELGYNPDSDVENTADSVFCAHGAGFTVKWDEVYKYMHLESALKSPEEIAETENRIADYIQRAATDEELLRIFERTYGSVKTAAHTAMQKRSKKTAAAPKFKSKPLPTGPEYLLVDGYNIIFAWNELKDAAAHSLDLAREMLINKMCNYCGFSKCELILVFDAYKVKENPGEVEKVNNINVVYTKEAETADAYIEKVTRELAKKHRVRVATSDNLEQLIILGNGAIRVSASEFEKEVETAENEIRKFISQTF